MKSQTLTCLVPPFWHHLPGSLSECLSHLLLTDNTGKLDANFDGWLLLSQGFFFGFSLEMGPVEIFLIVGFTMCVDEEQRTSSSECSGVQEVMQFHVLSQA